MTLRRPSPSPRVCTNEGRSHGDVITEFSQLDGLPIFLTNDASRAEALLKSGGSHVKDSPRTRH